MFQDGWCTISPQKILVIDNDERICQLITLILQREGYRVESTTDGKKGIERARTFRPALVLLDIVMPEMGGLEICRRIRTFSNVPVLFVSALSDDQTVRQALALGDGYLMKPFARAVLLASIRSLLGP